MINFKKIIPFIFLFIVSFFAFLPLLDNGFFPIHDTPQVARVYEMTKALKDGMFPVRWVQDLGYGYGYPIFNFYNPLPYYIAGFIGYFTDALQATKLLIVITFILSSFSMFFLARRMWGEKAGIFASILYLLAPYHAVDIYVRGDVAEAFAYAVIPLIFYGLLNIYDDKNIWKNISIIALSFAALITSHNLSAVIVSPFLIVFIVFLNLLNRKNNILLYSIFGLMLGIMISAFYSFPTLLEMNFSNVLSQVGGGANFRDHFVCLSQFWASPWGFGGSVKGCLDGMSFMIGKYHILSASAVLFTTIFFLIKGKLSKSDKQNIYLILFLIIGLIVSVFMSVNSSRPVWEFIKFMEILQYPWRFLIMISFFVSLLSGALIWQLERLFSIKLVSFSLFVLIILFAVIVNLKYFVPQVILNVRSNDYTNKLDLSWSTSKISDEYMPKNFKKPESQNEVPDINNLSTKSLSIKIVENKTQRISLETNSIKKETILLPVAYFPAWNATVDGKSVQLVNNSQGMKISVPEGKHTVILAFKQTLVEKISNLMSITGILIIIIGIIYIKLKK